MSLPLPVGRLSAPAQPHSWRLPARGLAVFHGEGKAARLSHYFLPRLLAARQRVLYLDGANQVDPLLIARLARQRGQRASEFNQRIKIARAFTCFQLTELLARVPRALRSFPAGIVIVTALPDVYFDEDVREEDARASFARALTALGRLAPRPLCVAVFSDADTFITPRQRFFTQLAARAHQIWKFQTEAAGKPALFCERARLSLSA